MFYSRQKLNDMESNNLSQNRNDKNNYNYK